MVLMILYFSRVRKWWLIATCCQPSAIRYPPSAIRRPLTADC